MSLISEQIPVISLEKLTASSADPAAAKMRYSRLIAKFQSTFGRAPEFICRSPGRVNLIGEHIDYSGFSVLPMAIDRDMVMAVSCQPGESRLANSNDAKYPTKSFQSDPNIVIDASIHGWANYFLCGYKGVASKLNLKEMKPMQVMCDGTVPAVCIFLFRLADSLQARRLYAVQQ